MVNPYGLAPSSTDKKPVASLSKLRVHLPRTAAEIGSRERSCTFTGGVLNAVPLLLGYATIVASAAGLAPARTRLKGVALDYFAFADVWKMAERGGHAPLALWAHDVFSKDSRLARPVHVPFSKLVPTVGLAPTLSEV